MADNRARVLVVAASIVVLTNGPLFFVSRDVLGLVGTWEGPFMRPMILATVATSAGFVALDRFRLSGERLRRPAAVPLAAAAALGGWATLSTFWSLQPEITLWRGLVYTAMPLVAWVIADLSGPDFVRALALAAASVVATSIVVVVAWSGVGTDSNDDWRGVMTNRNGFAPICGLAVIAGLALMAEGRRRLGFVIVAGAGLGLLGSGSRTAWFAVLIAVGVASVGVIGRARYLAGPKRSIIVTVTGLFVVGGAAAAAATAVLWNTITFGQRRTIWRLLGDHIDDRPLHGFGWESFWHTPNLHTDELLQRGSAHGSVPELLLGVGVIGLLLWLIVVIAAIAGVGREMWNRPSVETWIWGAMITFLLIENLTESYVLWFSYNWVLLIAAALRFGPLQPREREPQTPGPTATATSLAR